MKTKYFVSLISCLALLLAGCNKAKQAVMQAHIDELQSNNVVLQRNMGELSSSNLVLQGTLLQLQEKVKSGEQLNTLLRQQLESVNAQLIDNVKITKENAEKQKLKPIEDIIRAFRNFDSAISVSVTLDEFRKKLQDIKGVLDDNTVKIEDDAIKRLLQMAYGSYHSAYDQWIFFNGLINTYPSQAVELKLQMDESFQLYVSKAKSLLDEADNTFKKQQ